MENEESIRKILYKIAFRPPSDEWQLEDEEYEILDSLKGEEIMSVAYKNKLNPLALIKNADLLVEQYNDKFIKNIHKTIKNLKKDLMSELPRHKKTSNDSFDPDEVERRIINEVIEEVAGLAVNQDEEILDRLLEAPEVNVQEELMKRRSSQWQSQINTPNNPNQTPSMQRNFVSNAHITLPEDTRKTVDLDDLEMNSMQLPAATDEEIAELGMFDTPFGRQIFDKINAKEPPISALNTPQCDLGLLPILEPELPNLSENNIPVVRDVTNAPEVSGNVPEIEPPPPPALQKSLDVSIPIPRKSRRTVKQMGSSTNSSDNSLQMENISTVHHQIIQEVRKDLVENEVMIQKSKKKKAAPRRRRRLSISPSRTETQEMHKNLILHPKKVLQEQNFNFLIDFEFGRDIFDGLEDYVTFGRDLEEEVEEVQETLKIMQTPQIDKIIETIPENVPEIPIDSNIPLEDVQPLISIQPQVEMDIEPIIPNDVEMNLQLMGLEIQPEVQPNVTENVELQDPSSNLEVPSLHTTEVRTPASKFVSSTPIAHPRLSMVDALRRISKVSNISSIPSPDVLNLRDVPTPEIEKDIPVEVPSNNRNRQSKISLQDIRFAKLKRNSQRNFEPVSLHVNEDEDALGSSRKRFEIVPGKTEELVKFTITDGTFETYSKYCMETIALLFQIRFIMKQDNCEKLKFVEILPKLSLLDPNARRGIFEQRIEILSDFKYLNLTYDDEDDIDEIEIASN